MEFRVEWAIEVDADNPIDAARRALAEQKRPATLATVFDVTGEDGETVRVDLLELEMKADERMTPK